MLWYRISLLRLQSDPPQGLPLLSDRMPWVRRDKEGLVCMVNIFISVQHPINTVSDGMLLASDSIDDNDNDSVTTVTATSNTGGKCVS